MKASYIVIGDIKRSRLITDRESFQKRLRIILEDINSRFSEYLESRFEITLGDEFQGFLLSPEPLFEIIIRLDLDLYPVECRYSLGVGPITTQVNPLRPLGSDGPVFWGTRDLLTLMKSKHQKGLKEVTHLGFYSASPLPESDLINMNLVFVSKIMRNWTEDQRNLIKEIVRKYGMSEKFEQAALAKEMGLSPADVNRKLKRCAYYDVVRCFTIILSHLKKEG